MSDDDNIQMIDDLQTGIKVLRKQNDSLIAALKEILHATKIDLHRSEIDKIMRIDKIALLAKTALESIK